MDINTEAQDFDNANYISGEKAKLLSRITNIDERLNDFKELLKKTVNCSMDYSLDSLKYVELLLMNLNPSLESDEDLLIDSALYLGETVKRTFDANWDISDDEDDSTDHYGQPIITGHNPYEDFYPFLEIRYFIANPAIGYFKGVIQRQVRP